MFPTNTETCSSGWENILCRNHFVRPFGDMESPRPGWGKKRPQLRPPCPGYGSDKSKKTGEICRRVFSTPYNINTFLFLYLNKIKQACVLCSNRYT